MAEPGWDVYVITKSRTADAIWTFVQEYVDFQAAEDRGDEELMLLPLGADHPEPLRLDLRTAPLEMQGAFGEGYEWEPAISLSHTISRGLDQPYRAFMVYALPARLPEHLGATIGFTAEGGLLLGVEVRTRHEAGLWLRRLADEFDAQVGLVTDDAAPYSDAEAREMIFSGRAHLHWERGRSAH